MSVIKTMDGILRAAYAQCDSIYSHSGCFSRALFIQHTADQLWNRCSELSLMQLVVSPLFIAQHLHYEEKNNAPRPQYPVHPKH